jgi:UDP-N-acetylmuramoylalanine--D-glutamate ligase
MKIAILGFGKEGVSALAFLKRTPEFPGAEIWILDNNEGLKLPRGVFSQLGKKYLHDLERFDLIIRSPGIRYHLPELQAAIRGGVEVTSPIKLFFERCPAQIIGVTGTKGKGTTSTLIYKILKAAGKKVFLTGNIGGSAMGWGLDFLPKLGTRSWVVLELSSFQLMDLRQSPHIAVALMITSEHLDWHKSTREYRDAKASIVRFQSPRDFAVLAHDYPASRVFAKLTRANVFEFSRRAKLKGGTHVENGYFWFSDGWRKGATGNLPEGGRKEKICAVDRLQIPGEHNWENVGAAITVAKILKIPNAVIAKTVYGFKGLEHRLEFVAEKRGVRYYNDSYATTPETTIAAIQAFAAPKILILGGSSKGSDFTELGRVIAKSKTIKGVVGIGAEWPRIKAEIRARRSELGMIEGCKNMKEIIRAANSLAAPGDVVLLSPACASFGMFKNYGDRGKQFKNFTFSPPASHSRSSFRRRAKSKV